MAPKLVSVLAVLLLSMALVALPSRSGEGAGPVDFALTILHSNNGESALIEAPGAPDFGGAARFKTLVDRLRDEAAKGPNPHNASILLSGGDSFIAGPEWNSSLRHGPVFYDTLAMALIGYDAAAIGNHEFDFGPDTLAQFICGFLDSRLAVSEAASSAPYVPDGVSNCDQGESTFAFVAANLDVSLEPALQELVRAEMLVKSHVIEKGGERIGIVGAASPEIPFISSPRYVIVDPKVVASVQAQVDDLTRVGVNKVIVISHLSGLYEDLALAQQLRDVDVMVSGGGDNLLANPGTALVPGDAIDPLFPVYPIWASDAAGRRVPVVGTAGDYRYVGRLTANFDSAGHLVSIDPGSGPVRVAGGNNPDAVAPDPLVQQLVTNPVQAYVADLQTTVIAHSEVALDGRSPDPIRLRESNLGNLVADSWLWQAQQLARDFDAGTPRVAIVNGGAIRNNSVIPAGPITLFNSYQVAPLPSFISVVEDVAPAELKSLLENAVSVLPVDHGRLAHIAGMRVVYDLSGAAQTYAGATNMVTTPGTRIVSITLDDGTRLVECGQAVAGAPSVDVAAIDFLVRGGDQYPFVSSYTNLGVNYQQALENYLVEGLGGAITAADYPAGGEGRLTSGSGCR